MSAAEPTPHDRDRPDPAPPSDAGPPGRTRPGWAERRRDRIAAEVARNRRGEYTVPTWVLAFALALIVGGWLAIIVVS